MQSPPTFEVFKISNEELSESALQHTEDIKAAPPGELNANRARLVSFDV